MPIRRQKSLPTTRTEYPLGTFIHTEKGYFYIKDQSKRLRLPSHRVVKSWAPPRVVETTEAAVAHYRITAKMKFRNGSLIWGLSDGKLYLIEEGLKRHIVSPEALERIGAKQGDALVVSKDEINLHQTGDELK